MKNPFTIRMLKFGSGEKFPVLSDSNNFQPNSYEKYAGAKMYLNEFVMFGANRFTCSLRGLRRFFIIGLNIFLGLCLFANFASATETEVPLRKRPKFEQLKIAEMKVNELMIQSKTSQDENLANILSSQMQKLGAIQTFVGDAFNAMKTFDDWAKLVGQAEVLRMGDLKRLDESEASDAIDAIIREAKSRQIVILNEAHHIPLHRAFAMRLARELRKIGYQYLACETLDGAFDDGRLNQSSGYYSQEPMYGNFLRDAANDGWKIVGYEPKNNYSNLSWKEVLKLRESGQAKNIIAATLSRDSQAKIFIYVGYAHVLKSGNKPSEEKWMAEYLQELTHLDPLSIDQTVFYAHTTDEVGHPLYNVASRKYGKRQAFVLKSKEPGYQVFSSFNGRTDIQVIHPRYSIDPMTNRYEWLSSLAQLEPVNVPPELLPKQGRRVVYAFRTSESIDAIPVDAVVVESGKPTPKFMLPRGDYRFVVEE